MHNGDNKLTFLTRQRHYSPARSWCCSCGHGVLALILPVVLEKRRSSEMAGGGRENVENYCICNNILLRNLFKSWTQCTVVEDSLYPGPLTLGSFILDPKKCPALQLRDIAELVVSEHVICRSITFLTTLDRMSE